ncbi:MAG: DUF3592 domain-containing protein [Anaerolineaceae bacterium]|nr:DUF3592 domain-containing protein [Anaerolineaceae bacterium]
MSETSEILRPLLCGLFCIGITFFVIIGAVILLRVNRTRSREKVAVPPNWPAVQGRVTAASVEETARTRVEDDAFFYPNIKFEYTVEGQVYTGSQAVGRPFNVEFKAKQKLANYPPGTEVTVYYDPTKPDENRLMR